MRAVCAMRCTWCHVYITGPDDPPDEDAIPLEEARHALAKAKNALMV